MHSPDEFTDGAPVGRDASAPAPAARRTSNAFGSPGTDTTVKRIDLNDALIKHPDATFVMRAAGNSMHGAGIDDGDVLLVDRAVAAAHGAIVIAIVEGDLLCRRLEMAGGKPARAAGQRVRLVAADETTEPIDVGQSAQLEVWGVVTTVIKSLSF
jgi:DNA polymerase V